MITECAHSSTQHFVQCESGCEQERLRRADTLTIDFAQEQRLDQVELCV